MPLVTVLPEYAFSYCSKLTAFNWSNIAEIQRYAFIHCGLTEVNGPLVSSLGSYAFSSCKSLSRVEFPKVTNIPEYVFNACSSLTKAKFPKATYLSSTAFYECSKLSTLIVGTELDDETTICTLSDTYGITSNISAIYVPYNLQREYKTATNWSKFANKIQAYDVPVSCQSLTITVTDVPWYKSSAEIHYEAICTYSIEGIMQTGTKVFKGDVVSDTFGTNLSEESSRQIEVSYTFLGQTATTTITQGKYLGNPVGGKIYYIDDTAYSFYDAEGNLMSDVSVGSTPSYYKVITPGSKDKYYVYYDELYTYLGWGQFDATEAIGTTIGTGKSNTETFLTTEAGKNDYSIWYKLQQVRNTSPSGCNDWFVPSKDEVEALKLAIGCTTSTSGAVVVDASAVTGGNIAGTADGQTHYVLYNGTYYCYPSDTPFLNRYLWSSSEYPGNKVWYWHGYQQSWESHNKGSHSPSDSVFFVRAF